MRGYTLLVNRKSWHKMVSMVEEEFQYAGNSRHCSNIHRCYLAFYTESIFTRRQVEKRYVMFIRIYPFFVNTRPVCGGI